MIIQGPAELQSGLILKRVVPKKPPSKDGGFEVINESRTQR